MTWLTLTQFTRWTGGGGSPWKFSEPREVTVNTDAIATFAIFDDTSVTAIRFVGDHDPIPMCVSESPSNIRHMLERAGEVMA